MADDGIDDHPMKAAEVVLAMELASAGTSDDGQIQLAPITRWS